MVFRRGMPADGVIGYWDADWNHDMNSAVGFTRNRTFIDLLQRVMCAELLATEGIHEAAAERGSGGISIIDLRNPYDTEEMVLPEDFLGAFEIVDGAISAETYHRNPGYRLIGVHGRFQLPPAQEAVIRAEVFRAAGRSSG